MKFIQKTQFFTNLFLGLTIASLVACGNNKSDQATNFEGNHQGLYSYSAVQKKINFTALYKTNYKSLEDFKKTYFVPSDWQLQATVKYLFGPLVENELGGPQKGEKIFAFSEKAFLKNGFVFVPYSYEGTWLIRKDFAKSPYALPLPYHERMWETPQWKSCGDSQPDHQTQSFLWYFWLPSRYGCDQKLDVDYQMVDISLSDETEQTISTFPEYNRMIRVMNGKKVMKMTYAFGYVSDSMNPNPFKDGDAGMDEFRKFTSFLKTTLAPFSPKVEVITQNDYNMNSSVNIGTKFVLQKNGIEYQIKVVAAAGVDQMMLFARSFAYDHDSAFSWFGHSRVGSGFDADQFKLIVTNQPSIFKITEDYQLIYWAGCNSYSYYTVPFFNIKSERNYDRDPQGTKNLDIISNGLPSYFSVNADNAKILFKALFNPELKLSYQNIVSSIELFSNRNMGNNVLVNVLGDEDNLQ